jgi:hypothetical protein
VGLAWRSAAFVWAASLWLSVGVAQDAPTLLQEPSVVAGSESEAAPADVAEPVAAEPVDERQAPTSPTVAPHATDARSAEPEVVQTSAEPSAPQQICGLEAAERAGQSEPAVPEYVESEPGSAESAEPNTWERVSEGLRLDLGLTYATFEQQVKSEVGGISVEPIVEDRSFGLALTATYGIWKYIRLGVFFQLDMGSRFSSRYAGLDASGTPVINGRIGGSYREFWMGPLLRVQWKGIAAELGYGAFGVRSDDARDDLPTAAGETGALRTSPRIAWHAALSGYVPVHPNVDIVFRVQYRVRYYNRRSGDSLAAGVVHGTQNLTPTVGVSWRL